MSIFKESFRNFVRQQIKLREKIISIGVPFLLASSVDIPWIFSDWKGISNPSGFIK